MRKMLPASQGVVRLNSLMAAQSFEILAPKTLEGHYTAPEEAWDTVMKRGRFSEVKEAEQNQREKSAAAASREDQLQPAHSFTVYSRGLWSHRNGSALHCIQIVALYVRTSCNA